MPPIIDCGAERKAVRLERVFKRLGVTIEDQRIDPGQSVECWSSLQSCSRPLGVKSFQHELGKVMEIVLEENANPFQASKVDPLFHVLLDLRPNGRFEPRRHDMIAQVNLVRRLKTDVPGCTRLIYWKRRLLKARTSSQGKSKPFTALTFLAEASVPILLDALRVICLDDMDGVGFLGQLDCEFAQTSTGCVRSTDLEVLAGAKEIHEAIHVERGEPMVQTASRSCCKNIEGRCKVGIGLTKRDGSIE